MKLVPGDCISDPIAFTGVYDLAFTRVLVALARDPGGMLVDVGSEPWLFQPVVGGATLGQSSDRVRSVAAQLCPCW